MKHLKRLLYAVSLTTSLVLHAQGGDKGIKWTTGLSWEQVKQKAKAQNKYIFIDAYTTWCGPCKMMDKYVYINDTVGDFFNEHFIAVKAQMDVTDKDEQSIKDWYNDARSVEGDYAVIAYPSLIFLSPQSTVLYKMEGFRPVKEFVDTAKLILTNGRINTDPYKEYQDLVNEYKQGIKHYDKMPYMIRIATKLKDSSLARAFFKEHLEYVSGLKKAQRYSRENIETWAGFTWRPNSKVLQFFINDGNQIDQVMDQKGYATNVVDRSIQSKIVDSFFRMQKGETIAITGKKIPNSEIMFIKLPSRADGKIAPDYVEANWNELKRMIRKAFSKDYATRNVLTARLRWYQQHQNMTRVSEMAFKKIQKYLPENFDFAALNSINSFAWLTFLYVNDKELLKKAEKWMKKLIQQKPDLDVLLDTYSCLLYKLGRTVQAIQWEEKAMDVTNPSNKDQRERYKSVVEKMKRGEPVYLEQGAIWINK